MLDGEFLKENAIHNCLAIASFNTFTGMQCNLSRCFYQNASANYLSSSVFFETVSQSGQG
eukprot:3359097-Amphidinium_carterae.1